MAALTVRYEDDDENPIATVTALHFQATGLDEYDADPEQDDPSHIVEDTYYIKGELGGEELLRSHIFGPSAEGDAYWDDVVLPTDGSWTFSVMQRGENSDSQEATLSVTADAP